MTDVRGVLQDVFRQVFDDPTIVLRDEMTAADIEGWDSVTHIDLLIAVERKLGIKFATAEMSRLSAGRSGTSAVPSSRPRWG